jgi:hypothetical protein
MTVAKFFARETPWFVIGSIMLFAIGIFIGIVFTTASDDKSRALCDEAVHQVLTTKDPVELRRNIFLVQYLDCSIRRGL